MGGLDALLRDYDDDNDDDANDSGVGGRDKEDGKGSQEEKTREEAHVSHRDRRENL